MGQQCVGGVVGGRGSGGVGASGRMRKNGCDPSFADSVVLDGTTALPPRARQALAGVVQSAKEGVLVMVCKGTQPAAKQV